ncbi:unnamed protein product [marine sediment metagenome]|uniref:Uncharacterized protein n=1 Tax=marine sediment metagenome TaxID=412755 RepID=X1P5Y6_9ZZZZ
MNNRNVWVRIKNGWVRNCDLIAFFSLSFAAIGGIILGFLYGLCVGIPIGICFGVIGIGAFITYARNCGGAWYDVD